MTFATIDDWLDAVPSLFYATVAAGLHGTFQFELAGAAPFHITVSPEAARVERGRAAHATMTVTGSAASWLEAVNLDDRAQIWKLAEEKQLVLEPFDPARLMCFALALCRERAGAEVEFRKLLVGTVESWSHHQAVWLPFLRAHGLLPSHHLLDLGCGTLRVGTPLIEYLDREHYAGVDIRAEVFPEARKELAARGLAGKEPLLVHCADLRDLALRAFDVILASSVLVTLDDTALDVVLDAVRRHLAPTGAFYANVNAREFLVDFDENMRWLGFPWVAREMAFYRDVGRSHGLELADLGHPDNDAWGSRQQRIIRYQLR